MLIVRKGSYIRGRYHRPMSDTGANRDRGALYLLFYQSNKAKLIERIAELVRIKD